MTGLASTGTISRAALQAHIYVHSDCTYDLYTSNRLFSIGFESDLRDAAFGTL